MNRINPKLLTLIQTANSIEVAYMAATPQQQLEEILPVHYRRYDILNMPSQELIESPSLLLFMSNYLGLSITLQDLRAFCDKGTYFEAILFRPAKGYWYNYRMKFYRKTPLL